MNDIVIYDILLLCAASMGGSFLRIIWNIIFHLFKSNKYPKLDLVKNIGDVIILCMMTILLLGFGINLLINVWSS